MIITRPSSFKVIRYADEGKHSFLHTNDWYLVFTQWFSLPQSLISMFLSTLTIEKFFLEIQAVDRVYQLIAATQ